MVDIAEGLGRIRAVLARAYYDDSFTRHIHEVRNEADAVVVVVDADPGDRFSGLDVVLEVVSPNPRMLTAFDELWNEVVYDLFAYTEPLSSMGRQLGYQRISRLADTVVVVVTDGRRTKSYVIELTDLGVGYPDDFATDFLTSFPDGEG